MAEARMCLKFSDIWTFDDKITKLEFEIGE